MIEIKTFKNKKGNEIKYLSIPNGKYPVSIGFVKTQAVLKNAQEIQMILSTLKKT